MRVTLYIRPLSEAEEIEMLPARYPIKCSHFREEVSRDRYNQPVMSEWKRMLNYRCYCGAQMSQREDSKNDIICCWKCKREWCRDRVDNSICRITDDPAVLHELR